MILKELLELQEEAKRMSPLSLLKKVVMPKIKEALGAKSVVEAIPSHLNAGKGVAESDALWNVIDGKKKKKLSSFEEPGANLEGDTYTWEVKIHECEGVKIAELYLDESGPGEDSTFVVARSDLDKFKS